ENFQRVADTLTRRDFMKSLVATGAVVVPVSAAAYFKYADSWNPTSANAPKPVRTALIGAGDERGVLVGEHTPQYVKIVAVADIRRSTQERISTGDIEPPKDKPKAPKSDWVPKKGSPRLGLNHHYKEEAKSIKVYDDYKKVLEDPTIEAVIIALPLHLHAPVVIEALNAKKHVLCEKVMAWNITLCKQMIEAAEKNDRILSIGHQRHYSLLYAHALEMVNSDVLGDMRHIRALWHRNNGIQKFNEK